MHTDIFDLSRAIDINGTNLYPPGAGDYALDWTRGKRGRVLILEQRSGQPHWGEHTKPGWMRLWAWRSIAHGACGINFFRWRTCTYGQEEYWHGILPHSGKPSRLYDEGVKMGKELSRIGSLIDGTRPKTGIAIVMSYETRWAYAAIIRTRNTMDPNAAASRFHLALMRDNYVTDAFDPHEDLTSYKLVFAPRLYLLDDAAAENLLMFVRDGGVLVLSPRSGAVDEFNKIRPIPVPGRLAEAAGVEVHEYGALTGPLALEGEIDGIVEATFWADEIVLKGARAMVMYSNGWLTGLPAITLNEYGNGKVIYLGTVLQNESLQSLVRYAAGLAGVSPVMSTPEGIQAYERRSDRVRLVFSHKLFG